MIVVRSLNTVFAWYAPGINALLQQLSRSGKKRFTIKNLEDITRSSHTHLIVIEDTDAGSDWSKRVIGMGLIFFQPKPSGWFAEIHDIVRDENTDKKGLGTDIVRELLSKAQVFANEVNEPLPVSLTSSPSRVEANKLYRKLGFTIRASAVGERGTNLYTLIVEPSESEGD